MLTCQRGWGGTPGLCGKLDQVELKPLPTLRILLGISLSFIQVTISHVPRLGTALPDPTLHRLILCVIPGAILKSTNAN